MIYRASNASVSHVDSVQEMFVHVFIINFIPIVTNLSDFFIVLLVNEQAIVDTDIFPLAKLILLNKYTIKSW